MSVAITPSCRLTCEAVPRYCSRCVLPETRPGVHLEADGMCVGCHNAARKAELDWDARARAFRDLAENVRVRARQSSHDCVIPVSGGKDSFWQVATCLEHGLRPLCVTYVEPGRTELGDRNLAALVAMGVDHLDFRLNPRVERHLMARSFRETGISGLVSHMAIYAYPLGVALSRGIPLVVYGENSAFEYGSEDASLMGARVDRRWLRAFGVTAGTVAADWVDDVVNARDLAALTVPDEAVLAGEDLRAIFLGHYFPWDPQRSYRIAAAHGFAARDAGARVGHYDFANVDDDMIGVHHHLKWHKFGITRTWDTLSMEIRAGRLTREEAIETIRARGDETPWDDIDVFCRHVGIERAEYFRVAESFRNRELWSRRDGRWVIEDFLVPDYSWPADVES